MTDIFSSITLINWFHILLVAPSFVYVFAAPDTPIDVFPALAGGIAAFHAFLALSDGDNRPINLFHILGVAPILILVWMFDQRIVLPFLAALIVAYHLFRIDEKVGLF